MNGAADLDGVLDALVRNGHTPGFQYAAVDASSTLVEYHGGLADIAAHRPMQAETTMMAYSRSGLMMRSRDTSTGNRMAARSPFGSSCRIRRALRIRFRSGGCTPWRPTTRSMNGAR